MTFITKEKAPPRLIYYKAWTSKDLNATTNSDVKHDDMPPCVVGSLDN